MNADDKRPAARPVWKLPLLVAALVVGVWQYWSWGPYTVTLEAEGTETKDFVVECSYATKWVHSVERLYAHASVIGHGQSVKCPRHFLGPFGVGMTASIYHPEYQERWFHTREKAVTKTIILRPQELDMVLAEKNLNLDTKQIMTRHISGIEHHYLPVFDADDRRLLAERYVERLQGFALLAGGIYDSDDDKKVMEYIDSLFRSP